MGIRQLYNDILRKLPNEYGDISVMCISYTGYRIDDMITQDVFFFFFFLVCGMGGGRG